MVNRDTPEYREWRQKVLERDKRKCVICGATKYLEVHHIETAADNPELLLYVDNGITLCRKHHYKVKAKEKLFAPLFKALVHKVQLIKRDYFLLELINRRGKITILNIKNKYRRTKRMAKKTVKKTKMPKKGGC